MSSDIVKIRVRTLQGEAEIEASLSNIHEAINLVPELVSKLPAAEVRSTQPMRDALVVSSTPSTSQSAATPAAIPVVNIEKGDSLSDVISKFFSDSWGRNPRRLLEVREALQSYGLNYPKQSVAVALLRLAKASKIRRFKGEAGEYVYTSSTAAIPSQLIAVSESTETHSDQVELQSSVNL